jgi:putative ribosome biogenesis GTPase RsgA
MEEEIKSSENKKKSQYPLYLVVGDSGAGKSTFINNILGSVKAFAPTMN